ncbi:hypothetical protein BaRGS_00017565, partial [Batillaria attramentaria]
RKVAKALLQTLYLEQRSLQFMQENSKKTRACLLESEERYGRTIEILECHGEFDTKNTHEDVPVDIAGALVGTHPGPHAILYVVPTVERYTDGDFEIFERLKRYLGPDVDSLSSTSDDQYYQTELSRRIGQALEEEIKSREKHFEETETQAAKHILECHGEFDTKNTHEDVPVDIAGALVGTHPGPHAILYVVPTVERYTDGDFEIFERLKRYLGPDVIKRMIVLLTHGDQLHVPAHQYIESTPPKFRQVLTECSDRYEVFGSNMTNDDSKVKTLLEKVDSLRSTTDDQYYQTELSRRIGQAPEEEIKSREKHFEETETQAAKH